jgi:ComF family protein
VKIIKGLNLLHEASLTVFYPQACISCSESVENSALGVTCGECWKKTKIFDGSETICYKCNSVLNSQTSPSSIENVNCHRCSNLNFTAARAVGIYEGALRSAILQLKEKTFVPVHLKNLLFQAQQKSPINQATKIIPVPLHQRRERERGFNQAALLAHALSQKSKLPVLEDVLIRENHTNLHRVGMDEQARRKSVEKAFTIQNQHLVQNEKILLIDDVFTTGATVSICSEVLKKAGANGVFVLTIARAA